MLHGYKVTKPNPMKNSKQTKKLTLYVVVN